MKSRKTTENKDNCKALNKLTRADLLELLIYQMKENERLKKELNEAKKKLDERKIAIETSGSIAEAALKISGIFEAAQRAVDLYKESSGLNDNDKSTVSED